MRRKWMVAAAVAVVAVVPFGGAMVPVGAQQQGETTFVIRKVVTGPATAGSTVVVECETLDNGPDSLASATVAELGFDAAGMPTTASNGSFVAVDGAWVFETTVPPSELDRPDCTATETETGGAASTAWTCGFEFTAGTPDPPIGCATAAGTGTGPVTVTFGDTADEIENQTWTVVFTNTYPEAVEVEPNFTG